MACTLPSRNMPTSWLPCTVSLSRCHFSLSPVFRFSVVLSGQPRSIVETFVKNPKGKGAIPGGKRQEMLVIHVLVENTVAKSDNGGGGETFQLPKTSSTLPQRPSGSGHGWKMWMQTHFLCCTDTFDTQKCT